MTKKLKPTRQPMPEMFNRIPTTIRFSTPERALLRKQAKRFTGGNLSEYIRYAALYFKPGKEDMEK